jgi:cytochrome c-type biogenesis protein CcmH/NrfF
MKFIARKCVWTAGCVIILAAAAPASAAPTQDEVLKSIQQNVNQSVDLTKAVPYFLVLVGAVILLIVYQNFRKRQVMPRRVNHSGKLTREISRALHLRSIEVKQLKILAEDQELQHPLILLLCPSALGKAIRSNNPKIDRAVLKQVVQRLRAGLSERNE